MKYLILKDQTLILSGNERQLESGGKVELSVTSEGYINARATGGEEDAQAIEKLLNNTN